jgi:aminoglycoside 3'-phosphotransferase-2
VKRVIASLPRSWQAELAASVIEPVTRGLGGASVFRVRTPGSADCYLKTAKGRTANNLRSEIARTEWLGGQGTRVPDVLRTINTGRMVAVMMSVMPGDPPQDCGVPTPDILTRIARAFAALHALPVAACPYDETLGIRLARARGDVMRGAIDAEGFDPRNQDVTPERLFERLVSTAPASEDLVVVHGDATFDNILVDGDGTIGFIDCGNAGRADRYIDLAIIATEIEQHFGAQWVEPFARAYSPVPWDGTKARFYSDLYEFF